MPAKDIIGIASFINITTLYKMEFIGDLDC